MQQIDIQAIKTKANEKHAEFIQDLGCHSDRVLAEHNLTMELAFTRVKFICDTFEDLKIVDELEIRKETGVRMIYLSKGGYANFVRVSTNGLRLIIDGASYVTSMKVSMFDDGEMMDNVSDDDFDWLDFSDKLLDAIHSIIYERKEAFEIKMWGAENK